MHAFECPPQHRSALEQVKRQVNIHHAYLDSWIYLFLSNKKFDVAETVAKLHRREAMEREVFANYTMTDGIRQSMRAGIVQYIGRDKEGRPILYFNTARDHPKTEQRPERQANLDMFLGWAVRCDAANPSSMVTWLINQKSASMMSNIDLIFQKDMALRISKFFPGVVARMYICNMGSALTFVMKPLLRQLPSAISDCIFMHSAGDIKRGELLKVIDAEVLPTEMGGLNPCDTPENYVRFASTIETYFHRCIAALQQGRSIKEMEMEEAFGVDADGQPLMTAVSPDDAAGAEAMLNESMRRKSRGAKDSVDTLEEECRTSSCMVTINHAAREVVVQSAAKPGRRLVSGDVEESPSTGREETVVSLLERKSSGNSSSASHSSGRELFDCFSESGTSATAEDCWPQLSSIVCIEGGLYRVDLSQVEDFSFSEIARKMPVNCEEDRDSLLRDWVHFRCQCVELEPRVRQLLHTLRSGNPVDVELEKEDPEVDEDRLSALLRRSAHYILNLFPQTKTVLPLELLDWYSGGGSVSEAIVAHPHAEYKLDCTSPDNLLLTAQTAAFEFIEDRAVLMETNHMKVRIIRRLLLAWPVQVNRGAYIRQLTEKAAGLWLQLIPLFRTYVEGKVHLCIAEFIKHYGLLLAGGLIDETAQWYQLLLMKLLQHRELSRRNWLFHVFPPPFSRSDKDGVEVPPSMAMLLQNHGDDQPSLQAAAAFITTAVRSVQFTAEEFASSQCVSGSGNLGMNYSIVERFLERTKMKIYIPYESQQRGLSAEAFIHQKRGEIQSCLVELQSQLKEFLLLSAVILSLQQVVEGMRDPDVKAAMQLEAKHDAADIAVTRVHQQVAMRFADICSEMQNSFGGDPFHLLEVHDSTRPDGYALGLEVMLAVAILQSRRRPAPMSPSSSSNTLEEVRGEFISDTDLALSISLPSQSKGPLSPVDGGSLVRNLMDLGLVASRLAAIKRRFVY